jgi:hypothetical protein
MADPTSARQPRPDCSGPSGSCPAGSVPRTSSPTGSTGRPVTAGDSLLAVIVSEIVLAPFVRHVILEVP